MFDRFELLIGDKINDVKRKKILVVGLGGVGGYTAISLARSGINDITIIDSDTIDITNINRQIIAFTTTVGKNKTDEVERMIKDINPNAKVTKFTMKLTLDNIDEVFRFKYDYIVDAVDDIKIKCKLIEIASKNNIKLISSMGTGNKMDPSKLKIMDLRRTKYDPIARILRKYVKTNRIKNRVMVVCSDEEKYTKTKEAIPSNSFVPAISGLLMTSYIINDIVGENNV